MTDQQHVHNFSGETSLANGHLHRCHGTTFPVSGTDPDHKHYIWLKTTKDFHHDHDILIETGPGLPVQGGHIHRFSGVSTFTGKQFHAHQFENATSTEVALTVHIWHQSLSKS